MNGLEDLVLRFTQAAAHLLWIGALLWLAAFLAERLLVRTSAGRHGVHLLGLGLTLVAFQLCFLIPGAPDAPSGEPMATEGSVAPRVATEPAVAIATSEADGMEMSGEQPPLVAPAAVDSMASELSRTAVEPPPAALDERTGDLWRKIAPWVTAIYAVGLVLMTLRLLLGWAGSARLRRRAEPISDGLWPQSLARMSRWFEVHCRVVIGWSHEVAAPVVMGLVKPMILVPVALASRLSPAQVEAVLAHELAHLHRRDHWAVMVQRLTETVLFFHPAVWWMSRRMDSLREEACDDHVIAVGCDPADYAEALVICSECRLERDGVAAPFAQRLAATGAEGASLKQRVLRLLGQADEGPVRLGRVGWVLAGMALGGAALTVAFGGLGREDLADFDFDDPPPLYEKGIEVADREQVYRVDGLRFEAAPLEWVPVQRQDSEAGGEGPQWELNLDLGEESGYEIVKIRLFDHRTRESFHTSRWRKPFVDDPEFLVERIGDSSSLRLRETGGSLPGEMDVWLRVVTQDSGPVFSIPAIEGATATRGGSELVITRLFSGSANGRSGPSGEMVWDMATVQDQDRKLTLNLRNRGKPLDGRYHVVAVTREGIRYPMDHKHFIDFSRNRGDYAHVGLDVALDELDHFEVIPFKARHKFFFNGLEVPGKGELPALDRAGAERLQAWIDRSRAGELSEKDFLLHVKQRGPQIVDGLIPYLDTGRTDRLAMKAIEQFEGHPLAVAYLEWALEELSNQPGHIKPNRRHCGVLLLGKMGGEEHADLISQFLDERPYAALPALSMIGGSRAVKHLTRAFDRLPEDEWWVIAQNLERAGDPSAVPELKERLAMVEAPPTERFTNNSVPVFLNAIRRLSDGGDGDSGSITWQQGQHFVYPFDGPGSPKSFSMDPPEDHYVRLPDADPATDDGRDAIWEAFAEETEGPGFTIDGDEVVLFNGLRAMPLWENGPPYPTTMWDWLGRVSHRELLARAKVEAAQDRVRIPDRGYLLALDPQDRLYGLSLKKTTDDPQYNVGLRAMDPLRQLVRPSPQANGPYTDWRGLRMHDLESGMENGALNLSRGHMMHLDEELFEKPGRDALLTADFAKGRIALGVPWAEEFVLIEAEPDLPADELVQRLALARSEKPAIEGHTEVGDREWRGHQFDRLEKDRCLGFAIRMPDGNPVAGLLLVREVDSQTQIFRGKHVMLFTHLARAVFDPDAVAGPRRFVGELASGLSVEMLGVGHSPSTGRPWWRADGRPLAAAPYHHINAGPASPKAGHLLRELALEEKWGEVDFVTTAVRWEITPNGGWGGHTGRDATGQLMLESENRGGESQRVREVKGFSAALPDDTVTIRREYAAGEYIERATWSADGTITYAAVPERNFTFSPPVDASDGLVITVENASKNRDWRLFLIGHDGEENRVLGISVGWTAGAETRTLRFREKGAKLAEVAEVRLESRPYNQWIEFRNVSLRPGVETEVQVVTSDMVASHNKPDQGGIHAIDPREMFLEIERFARLSEAEQQDRLADFYAELPPPALSEMVEGILSSTPHDILNPNAEGGSYDGHTFLWAEQLEAAAEEMTPEQVADQLKHVTLLRVVARARALQVFRNHGDITRGLVGKALESAGETGLSRASMLIGGLELKGFTDRLMNRWLSGDEGSEVARRALIFSKDPALAGKLMDRVEKDPDFLTRCSVMLQGAFAGKRADPVLLEFLDDSSSSHDRELAYHAASAMRYCVDTRLADTASRFAADEEVRFREVAAEMCPRLLDEAFHKIRISLLPLLDDPDRNVRGMALRGFSKKKDPAAGPVILEALKNEQTDEGFKIAVMQSMAELSGKSWNYNMQEWGLGSEGNREAVQRFAAWLESREVAAALETSGVGSGLEEAVADGAKPELVRRELPELGIRLRVPATWKTEGGPKAVGAKGLGAEVRFSQPGPEWRNTTQATLKISMTEYGHPHSIDVNSPSNPKATEHRIFRVAACPARLTGYVIPGEGNANMLIVQFARETRGYELTWIFPTAEKKEYLKLVDAVCGSVDFLDGHAGSAVAEKAEMGSDDDKEDIPDAEALRQMLPRIDLEEESISSYQVSGILDGGPTRFRFYLFGREPDQVALWLVDPNDGTPLTVGMGETCMWYDPIQEEVAVYPLVPGFTLGIEGNESDDRTMVLGMNFKGREEERPTTRIDVASFVESLREPLTTAKQGDGWVLSGSTPNGNMVRAFFHPSREEGACTRLEVQPKGAPKAAVVIDRMILNQPIPDAVFQFPENALSEAEVPLKSHDFENVPNAALSMQRLMFTLLARVGMEDAKTRATVERALGRELDWEKIRKIDDRVAAELRAIFGGDKLGQLGSKDLGAKLTLFDSAGQPIPGVRVQFEEQAKILENGQSGWSRVPVLDGVSDASGQVPIPAVESERTVERLWVRAEAEGYVSRWFKYDREILSQSDGTWKDQGYMMLKAGVLSGRVLDAEGRPLPGAPLSVTTYCNFEDHWQGEGGAPHGVSAGVSNHLRAITDDNGEFRIEGVPPGSAMVYYPWSGPLAGEDARWAKWTQQGEPFPRAPVTDRAWVEVLSLNEGEQVKGLVADLSKSTATVEGRVIDGDQQPVPDARVWVVRKVGNYSNLSLPRSYEGGRCVTGPDGKFRLSGLPPGTAGLLVKHEELESTNEAVPVELNSGQTTRAKLAMRGALQAVDALPDAVYLDVTEGQGLELDGEQVVAKKRGEKGVDVSLDNNELVGRGLKATVVDLPYEVESKRLTASHVRDALETVGAGDGRWPLKTAAKADPHEIAFVTRQGTAGVLAVVGYTSTEEGEVTRHRVKVRLLPGELEEPKNEQIPGATNGRSPRDLLKRGNVENQGHCSLIIMKERGGWTTPDGVAYSVDGEVIAREKLKTRLEREFEAKPDLEIRIYADPELPLSRVTVAMETAREAGFKNVRIATGEPLVGKSDDSPRGVDGVMVDLTSAKQGAPAGEWKHPMLELEYAVENRGDLILHLPENGKRHQVKVDGRWYEWVRPERSDAQEDGSPAPADGTRLLDLAPGKLFQKRRIRVAGGWREIPKGKEQSYAERRYGGTFLLPGEDDYGDELILKPGKHQVRVAVVCPLARAIQGHGVTRSVSQEVEITVSGSTDPDGVSIETREEVFPHPTSADEISEPASRWWPFRIHAKVACHVKAAVTVTGKDGTLEQVIEYGAMTFASGGKKNLDLRTKIEGEELEIVLTGTYGPMSADRSIPWPPDSRFGATQWVGGPKKVPQDSYSKVWAADVGAGDGKKRLALLLRAYPAGAEVRKLSDDLKEGIRVIDPNEVQEKKAKDGNETSKLGPGLEADPSREISVADLAVDDIGTSLVVTARTANYLFNTSNLPPPGMVVSKDKTTVYTGELSQILDGVIMIHAPFPNSPGSFKAVGVLKKDILTIELGEVVSRTGAEKTPNPKLPGGIYRVRPEGSEKEGAEMVRSDADGKMVLLDMLTENFGEVSMVSVSNDNTRLRIDLKSAGPFEEGDDIGHLALVVDGLCTGIWGHSELNEVLKMDMSSMVVGKDARARMAAGLGIEPKLRTDPGHEMEVTFSPVEKSFLPGEVVTLEMEIRNVGEKPFSFGDGGMQRGARNNQFEFRAFRDGGEGEEVPDTGDPEHHGGKLSIRTLKPGEVFEKEVDVTKWFDLSKPGTYKIEGRFLMEIFRTAERVHPADWDDVAKGIATVEIESEDAKQEGAAIDISEGEPFTSLTVAMTGTWIQPPVRMEIQGDGSYRYIEQRPRPGQEKARETTSRLSAAHLAELATLLRKTDWLSGLPIPDGPIAPPKTDQTRFDLTLDRDGREKSTVVGNFTEHVAYQEFVLFLMRLHRQEDLFVEASLGEKEKRSVTHGLGSELRAVRGEPHTSVPHDAVLDYRRMLPLYREALSLSPGGDAEFNEMVTAIRLVGQLHDVSFLDELRRLAGHESHAIRKEVAVALPMIEGEKALPVLRGMLDDTREAAVQMLKLGDAAVPIMVEMIAKAAKIRDLRDRGLQAAENIVRAHLTPQNELKMGGVDPSVLRAVRAFVAKHKGTSVSTEYYLKLLEAANPGVSAVDREALRKKLLRLPPVVAMRDKMRLLREKTGNPEYRFGFGQLKQADKVIETAAGWAATVWPVDATHDAAYSMSLSFPGYRGRYLDAIWQVFLVDPDTGAISLIKDRRTGERISLEDWLERETPTSVYSFEEAKATAFEDFAKENRQKAFKLYQEASKLFATGGGIRRVIDMFRAVGLRAQSGTDYEFCRRAAGLARQLESMAKEQEPEVDPDSAEGRLAKIIWDLRSVQGKALSVPGKASILQPMTARNDSKIGAAFLEMAGDPETEEVTIRRLVALLEDPRPTRIWAGLMNGGHFLRNGDVALELLSKIAGKSFDRRSKRDAYLWTASPELREEIIGRVKAWWALENNAEEAEEHADGDGGSAETTSVNQARPDRFHALELDPKRRFVGNAAYGALPLLLMTEPDGSRFWKMRREAKLIYRDGDVFYRPDESVFFIENALPGSSSLIDHGPYEGNPLERMRLPEQGITEFGKILVERNDRRQTERE